MARNIRRLGGLGLLSLIVLACGESTAVSPSGDQPVGDLNAETLSNIGTVPTAPSTTIAVVPDTPAPAATSTSVGRALEVVGPFEVLLPGDARDDPRPTNPLPDFVQESKQWLIPDESVLGIVVQDVAPAFPPEQSLGTYVVNGLTWELFDVGPANGWVIVAVTSVDGSFLAISAQGWTVDEREAPRTVIDEVLPEVHYRGGS